MSDHIQEDNAEEPVIGDAPPSARTFFSNRVYDVLKFIALVFLPASGTAYFALSGLWGLPYADQVVGTIVVADTFLGTVIGVSSRQYRHSDARFDGEIVVTPNEEGNSDLNLSLDSHAVAKKKEITVRVDRQ